MQHDNFKSALSQAALFSSAAILMLGALRAEAQDASTRPAGSILDEVVVTAEKRSTNLQDTPISISVADADALVARHVQSLADLGDGTIPSLRATPFGARNSALVLNIRGVGATGDANQPARDQAVGVYINGVYLGRAQGLGSALYDVERIEVLKGPQGTLFGRNTEGGAINITTRQPTGKFGLRASAGYGNFNAYKTEAHLDLPEFNGVRVKLDGLLSKRDGTITNPASDQEDFNAYDKRGFQGQTLWQVNDVFTADYAYDYSRDGTTPFYQQLLAKGSIALAPLMPPQPDRAERSNIGVPLELSVGKTWGHRLTLVWDANDSLQLKSISSYRDLSQTQFDNAPILSAFVPNAAFSRYSIARVWQDQASQELQLIGSTDTVEYAAGVFYFRENVNDNAQTPNTLRWNATGTDYSTLPLDLSKVPFDRVSRATTTSYGVFGQATWTPPALERLHLTIGGRETRDRRKGALEIVNGAVPSIVVDGVRQTGAVNLDAAWNHIDPLVTLAYDVSDDLHVYAKWSSGFRAGGANARSLTYRSFDPEVVKMYEVGTKTEFWSRRARLNVATYYGDMKDVQVDFNTVIVGNSRSTLETTNAGSGRTQGFEADFTVMPVEGLTFAASYAYTDVSLSNAYNPFTNAQSTVNPIRTPKNAGSLSADWEYPFMRAVLKAHIDGNYSDEYFADTTDPTKSDSAFVVNARLALSNIELGRDGAQLEVALWSRNLLDESHARRNFNAALGTYGFYNEPRTFGVEARVNL